MCAHKVSRSDIKKQDGFNFTNYNTTSSKKEIDMSNTSISPTNDSVSLMEDTRLDNQINAYAAATYNDNELEEIQREYYERQFCAANSTAFYDSTEDNCLSREKKEREAPVTVDLPNEDTVPVNDPSCSGEDTESPIATESVSIDTDYTVNKEDDWLMNINAYKSTKIDWLWENWLARGKLHILAGEPGVNKTTLVLQYAAIVSSGGTWFDGTKCDRAQDVLIFSNEDDISESIKPRVVAYGANGDKIYPIHTIKINDEEVYFDPSSQHHISVLSNKIRDKDYGLMIIDSLADVITGEENSNQSVRKSLKRICQFAEDHKIAVVGILHTGKSNAKKPTKRIIGSTAFVGMARLVQIITAQKDERRLARAKSNISGGDCNGFLFISEIRTVRDDADENDIPVPFLNVKEQLYGDPDEILDPQALDTEEGFLSKKESSIDKATSIINRLLNENNGEVLAITVYDACSKVNISEATTRTAKKKLGILDKKLDGNKSMWYRPDPTVN